MNQGNRAKLISLMLIMILSLALCSPVLAAPDSGSTAAKTNLFTDVNSQDKNALYITYMAQRGYISGFPDGSYRPAEGLTRAQAAALLCKIKGLNNTTAQNRFPDVSPDHWAAACIAAAADAGYIKGFPDGSFKPEENLSRAQGISLFLKLSSNADTGAELPQFEDIDNSHWAAPSIATALAAGMISIDNNRLNPEQAFSRGDLARALSILITKDPTLNQSQLIGKLIVKSGEVTFKRAGEEKVRTISGTTMVQPGDTITTGQDGQAEINYPDGSGILLKYNSELSIQEAKGRSYIKSDGQSGIAVDWLSVDLQKGKLFGALASSSQVQESKVNNEKKTAGYPDSRKFMASLNSRQLIGAAPASGQDMPWYETSKTKKVKVRVDMPWGVAAIRGSFWSNLVDSSSCGMTLLEGDGAISSGGQTQSLSPGQSSGAGSAGGPPSAPGPMSPSEAQDWSQQRDWVGDRANDMRNNQEAPPPGQSGYEPGDEPGNEPGDDLMDNLNDALDRADQTAGSNSSGSSGGSSGGVTLTTFGSITYPQAGNTIEALNTITGTTNPGSYTVGGGGVFIKNNTINQWVKPTWGAAGITSKTYVADRSEECIIGPFTNTSANNDYATWSLDVSALTLESGFYTLYLRVGLTELGPQDDQHIVTFIIQTQAGAGYGSITSPADEENLAASNTITGTTNPGSYTVGGGGVFIKNNATNQWVKPTWGAAGITGKTYVADRSEECIIGPFTNTSANNDYATWSLDVSALTLESGFYTLYLRVGLTELGPQDDQDIVMFSIGGQQSIISPSSAAFDKSPAQQTDITVAMTLNGNTLTSIMNAANTLVAGSDYTIDGSNVVIRKEYLANQAVGNMTLSFQFSAGNPASLVVNINDSSASGYTWGGFFNVQSAPQGVAIDDAGSIYVADYNNNQIFKFDSSGNILTRWGSEGTGDGQFKRPWAVAVDAANNVYVCDLDNSRIQKFNASGGFITKWGSNGGANGQFSYPTAVVLDSTGNVYIADKGNSRIQKFSADGIYISSIGSYGSGDGQFDSPYGIAIDNTDNIYVTDYSLRRVQKFASDGSFVCKFGSDGSEDGQLSYPQGITVNGSGNLVYVADTSNQRIQVFSYDVGSQNYIYSNKWGSYGTADGQFANPVGVILRDGAGEVYVADKDNGRIQKFDTSGVFGGKIEMISTGDGYFNSPERGIAVDSNYVYVSDTNNHRIQKFDINGSFITKWGTQGSGDGQFNAPTGLALDTTGNLYVADRDNHRIQKFSPDGSFICKWGSSGSGENQFDKPAGLLVDISNNVYVADYNNSRIQKFTYDNTVSNYVYSAQWGSWGDGNGQFNYPVDVKGDTDGNVYVSDFIRSRVQKFDANGNFITTWGSYGSADGQFMYQQGLGVDSSGNVYVADRDNNRIQKFDSNGVFIISMGTSGSGNGQLNFPTGVTVDSSGKVYVVDTKNYRIQVFSPSP